LLEQVAQILAQSAGGCESDITIPDAFPQPLDLGVSAARPAAARHPAGTQLSATMPASLLTTAGIAYLSGLSGGAGASGSW